MLRNNRPWLIALFVAIITILMVGRTGTFQYCVQENYPQGAQQNFEEYSPGFFTAVDCLGSVFEEYSEAVIAAFTVILAISTIFLWSATRDLVQGAEDTAERQLRAYISIDRGGIRQWVGSNDIVGHVIIRNAGQIPALNLRINIRLKLSFNEDLPFDTIPDPTKGKRVIQPRSAIE